MSDIKRRMADFASFIALDSVRNGSDDIPSRKEVDGDDEYDTCSEAQNSNSNVITYRIQNDIKTERQLLEHLFWFLTSARTYNSTSYLNYLVRELEENI